MATQDYAASIQGVSIRVTRLDAAGNLMAGAGDSYTTSAFMRVSFTPEYEEGDEITEKGANGIVCVTYKAPDTLKRITMELAICEPDPELSALVSGGLLLRKNLGTADQPDNKSIGWAAPGVGDDPAGNGVALEVWSHAIKDGKKSGTLPYFHWVFPYVKMRQSGDRVIENGLMANTFEGYGLGNPNFQSGLDGRWEFPVAAERPYAYARTDWAPTGLNGFYTWTDGTGQIYFTSATAVDASAVNLVSAAGTQSGNAATLTFSTAPAIAAGDIILVQGVGTAFNGTFGNGSNALTVSGNTVTYTSAAITADITSFNVGRGAKVTVVNSATEALYPIATVVTALPVTSPDATYNVPGSMSYNDDNPIDNIIQANENPTVA
jgi:hypothetical protein